MNNNLDETLKAFINNHPEVKGAYGYGSAVFKQNEYKENTKKQIDLILLVDDLRTWHEENIKENKKEYSFLGKHFIFNADSDKLKGTNGITYMSNIPFNDCLFKYGVMEEKDFSFYANTWKSIYVPCRFQKPVLEIQSTPKIIKDIAINREYALMIGSLLSDEITTKEALLKNIVKLSYIGDIRMSFAENPHKIDNIVQGSFAVLDSLYLKNNAYLQIIDDNLVQINHAYLLENISKIPYYLLNYILENKADLTDLESLRSKIYKFLEDNNHKDSMAQTIHGVKTNGIVRSIPYTYEKLKKGFAGKVRKR